MIAILDGDELAYKVGYGSQHTWYNVSDQNKNQLGRFKSALDAKEWMAGDEEGLVVEKEVDVLPERIALRNVKATIRELLNSLSTKEFILCFSSPINFRNEIATLQEYKSNREVMSKPIHLPAIKKYMMDTFPSNVEEGYEADDLLAIYYNDIDPNHEKKAVIVSQDKDLLQVPGWFLNLGTEKHRGYGDPGELFYITQEEGLYNFYSQLISGDTTDTIPGIYQITGTRNSKKFLDRLEYLKNQTHERDYDEINTSMYSHVNGLYTRGLGAKIRCRESETDLDCILWEIGNLLYMRRSFDDEGWKIPL